MKEFRSFDIIVAQIFTLGEWGACAENQAGLRIFTTLAKLGDLRKSFKKFRIEKCPAKILGSAKFRRSCKILQPLKI